MPPFQKILVSIDPFQELQPALEVACHLASLSDHPAASGGEVALHLVDNLRDLNLAARVFSSQWASEHQRLADDKIRALERLAIGLARRGFQVTTQLLRGGYSQQLRKAAEEFGADLIVRHAKGALSTEVGTLGATSARLLSRPPCPLWLVQGPQPTRIRKVLASIDANPDDQPHEELNRRILQRSRELTQRMGGDLTVAYAWDIYGGELLRGRLSEKDFEDILQRNRALHVESYDRQLAPFGLSVATPGVRLVRGEPTRVIPSLCNSESIDLLVCGTVARAGLSGWVIGNTADRMLRHVQCSILTLPYDISAPAA
jgi:universal stress protein E